MTGNIATLGIPLAFLVGLTVLLWYIIGGRGKWWAKVPVIALVAYLSMGLWLSMTGLLGWPTEEVMPNKFRIHWIVVQPPSGEKTGDGAVYVWAEDIQPQIEKDGNWYDQIMFPFHSKYEENDPRLYKLEYTKPLHKQSNQIVNNFLKKGKPYFGSMKKGKGKGEGEGNGKGKGEGEGNGKGRNGISGQKGNSADMFGRGGGEHQFYQLPPPKFPKKEPIN